MKKDVFICNQCGEQKDKGIDRTIKIVHNYSQEKDFRKGGCGFKIKFSDDTCFACTMEAVINALPKPFDGKFTEYLPTGPIKYSFLKRDL